MIYQTETKLQAMRPGIGEAAESPEGPGRDGNKPLMRNRQPDELPQQVYSRAHFPHAAFLP